MCNLRQLLTPHPTLLWGHLLELIMLSWTRKFQQTLLEAGSKQTWSLSQMCTTAVSVAAQLCQRRYGYLHSIISLLSCGPGSECYTHQP